MQSHLLTPRQEGVVTPAPLRAELAGLLLQMLGTGARRRRGGVFDVVVRRTARVRGAVGRTTRKQPIAVRKIYGPADRIAEIGCIGVTDFTHNERNLVVLIVGIVCVACRSVERCGSCQGCVGRVCRTAKARPSRSEARSVVRLTPLKGQVAIGVAG